LYQKGAPCVNPAAFLRNEVEVEVEVKVERLRLRLRG